MCIGFVLEFLVFNRVVLGYYIIMFRERNGDDVLWERKYCGLVEFG